MSGENREQAENRENRVAPTQLTDKYHIPSQKQSIFLLKILFSAPKSIL
jgi:hypothetical protein